MNVIFTYNPAKEIDTLRVALGGKQSSTPVSFGLEAKEAGIDFASPEQVVRFCTGKIEREELDMNAIARSHQQLWDPIETEVIQRFARIFKSDIDLGTVTAYLTLSQRFPYNWERRYYFVSHTYGPIKTSLHELTHFYTFALLQPLFDEAGISFNDFDSFKEALTILLNVEFSDLMNGEDRGYPQHQDLRKWIAESWHTGKDIYEISQEYITRIGR